MCDPVSLSKQSHLVTSDVQYSKLSHGLPSYVVSLCKTLNFTQTLSTHRKKCILANFCLRLILIFFRSSVKGFICLFECIFFMLKLRVPTVLL